MSAWKCPGCNGLNNGGDNCQHCCSRRDEPKSSVDHPSHYNAGKIEVIDFIEDQGLGYNLGNVVKYTARAEHKGSDIEDLKKAIWYLTREVARRDGTLVTTTQRNFGNAVISQSAT